MFSRDQKEKVYVQDRILEHADELPQWLEQDPYLYVCDEVSQMARHADAALRQGF